MTEPADIPRLYYRQWGVVTHSVQPPTLADFLALLRSSAFAKLWRGEAPTEEEAAALSEGSYPDPGRRLSYIAPEQLPSLVNGLAHVAPDLLARVDALANEVAQALGAAELVGWQVLASYTRSAVSVALARAGFDHEATDPASDYAEPVAGQSDGPDVWANSDGGPEGWSTVPPRLAKEPAR